MDIRQSCIRFIQDFHLVWLDESIDKIRNDDCHNAIIELRQAVNTVNTFTDVDECVDFITDVTEGKVFVISCDVLGQTMANVMHDMVQVRAIYIFCENKTHHEEWATQWSKVKGVFTDITPICEALKQAAQEYDRNAVSLSFVASNSGGATQNLNQLDPTFMYTQMLKEILLTIDFKPEHFVQFITYCREQLVGNITQLNYVDQLEREYRDHAPIWWYTCSCLVYSMLNRALRTMEVDLIIKMGFFVRDLHQHITRLHSEQYVRHDHSTSFRVYRGQGLSQRDFDQLNNTQGGLVSFNNFLSTSVDRAVSLAFAESNQDDPDLIGVLFQITIDPSISPTPFANIRDVSSYQEEEEILFSMHSIFRIGDVKQIDNNPRLWQVDLTLTCDNDPQLHDVTESMRREVGESTGWHRLAQLMIKVGQFNKAEELYQILLDQTSTESDKASVYHHLGVVTENQGKYADAVEFYEKAIKIHKNIFCENHPSVAIAYNNIGLVYEKMGEYSKALSSHEKGLEIYQNTLPAVHPLLATSNNNIGLVYDKIGEYSKALSYCEKGLEIQQQTLPANHPNLGSSYNNIGVMYYKMGQYSKALSAQEKSLGIRQKILPPNHPDLAITYVNTGGVYYNMKEYSKALLYYEKALEIYKITLPDNHPSLATCYNNIAMIYGKTNEYSKAVSYCEKDLEICKKSLPANHPDLRVSYNNIISVCYKAEEYSTALLYCEKVLESQQQSLPANHPHLATSYNNIGVMYKKMGEYSKAISYFEKALEIDQETLPAKHPKFFPCYANIGSTYGIIGEYSKALFFLECAHNILQHSEPENHSDLVILRASIEYVKKNCK